MNPLLEPLDRPEFIGVRNRIVMSAMSRSGADDERRVTEPMRDYYARRAAGGAGLILTEGTIVHRSGDGWNNAPRIETDEQAASWRQVTDAVHAEGGRIACQLWHMGRISHEDYTGDAPVSSTSRAAEGMNRQNGKPYGTPRALAADEMPLIYKQFSDAAVRAIDAGFDAVQVHLGHGYIADQFLDARVNDRTDNYGGSVENRCRFALELIEAVLAVVPAEQVVARISPSRFMGSIYDWPDLDEMLAYLIPELAKRGLQALDVSCARADYYETSGRIVRMIRPMWKGVLMGGASLTAGQAAEEVRSGYLDLVTWGRAFIANPDLVRRLERQEAWTEYHDDMQKVLL